VSSIYYFLWHFYKSSILKLTNMFRIDDRNYASTSYRITIHNPFSVNRKLLDETIVFVLLISTVYIQVRRHRATWTITNVRSSLLHRLLSSEYADLANYMSGSEIYLTRDIISVTKVICTASCTQIHSIGSVLLPSVGTNIQAVSSNTQTT